MDCKNINSSTTLQDLDDDCLIHIFSMLPIIDQIKIQRVSKRWRLLSRIVLNGLTTFEVYNKKFWGMDEESNIKINRDILKNVLKLYGRKITHIDLNNSYYVNTTLSACSNDNINIVPSKNVLQIIHELCPHIISLIITDECGKEEIRFIAENFRNLIYFTHYELGDDCHGELAKLISNNRNLKCLKVNFDSLPFSCFSNLNSESIEEINFSGDCNEFVPGVIRCFEKLHILSLSLIVFGSMQIMQILKTIGSYFKNLKKLKLRLLGFDEINRNVLLQGYNFIIALTDLEELYIADKLFVNNNFIEIVCNNCKKLKTLKISYYGKITDEGISKIQLLPNLQNLYIKETQDTGSFLMHEVPKLRNLVFRNCNSLQDKKIIFLLLNSQYIENLEIDSCECIDGIKLINTMIKNIKDRKCKNVKIKIIEPSLTNIEILEIRSEFYTRTSKKFCRRCSKRREFDPQNENFCKDCIITALVQKIPKD